MLKSSSGWKRKKCETTSLFIAMHYQEYTSLEVKGRWGLLLPPCLLITAVQQPGNFSPPSRLKRSSTGVIWMCKASFTNNCPLPWSSTVVSSQWIGWWCSHACSATADFSIIPSCMHFGVPSASSPVSIWSLRCRLGRSCIIAKVEVLLL